MINNVKEILKKTIYLKVLSIYSVGIANFMKNIKMERSAAEYVL